MGLPKSSCKRFTQARIGSFDRAVPNLMEAGEWLDVLRLSLREQGSTFLRPKRPLQSLKKTRLLELIDCGMLCLGSLRFFMIFHDPTCGSKQKQRLLRGQHTFLDLRAVQHPVVHRSPIRVGLPNSQQRSLVHGKPMEVGVMCLEKTNTQKKHQIILSKTSVIIV